MDKRSLYLGASMSASWAWGSSLLVGSIMVQERGLIPFIIWATCNALMLSFFGYMVKKFPNFEKATSTKVFVVMMTIMQFFITWVNMQTIFQVGVQVGLSETVAKTIAMVVALAFILMVFKKGLELAVVVSTWEWFFMLFAIVLIVGLGLMMGEPNHAPLLVVGEGHIGWAIFGGLSLLCGGFIDLQQWQRAKTAIREKREISFVIGSGLFAVYMALVGLLGVTQLTFGLSIALFVVALLCTTDTLVSVGSALQEVGGKKYGAIVGAILGVVAVVLWNFVYSAGIMEIWNYYATFRLVVVSVMIITVLVWTYAENKRRRY